MAVIPGTQTIYVNEPGNTLAVLAGRQHGTATMLICAVTLAIPWPSRPAQARREW